MVNNRNVEIFRDTLKQVADKYPVNTDDIKYYNGIVGGRCDEPCPPVIMIKGGTVSTGYSYADKYRVAILNFADALVPGGLVEVGAHTQEENICRCSNLYPTLANEKSAEEYYIPNMRFGNHIYTDRIIYSRDITVFKDDETYENIEPRKMDVITCPAPNTGLTDNEAIQIYRARIEQIVLSAVVNKAECIVLGAWGCGAFGQSPDLVARAFADVLNEYGGHFKKIVFAIRPTYGEAINITYRMFDTVINKYYEGGVIYEE